MKLNTNGCTLTMGGLLPFRAIQRPTRLQWIFALPLGIIWVERMRWQNGGSVCWKQNCNRAKNLLHFTFLPSNALKDIWGLYGAPNQIFWRRDCCLWKAVLIAKYPVKMQNSSQTKDLIKDHFSFTAFFTIAAVYGILSGFTVPLPLPWVYWM